MSCRGATELLGGTRDTTRAPVPMGRWQLSNPSSVSGGGAVNLKEGGASREELRRPQLLHRSRHDRFSIQHGGLNDSGQMEKFGVPHLHQDQSEASVRAQPYNQSLIHL